MAREYAEHREPAKQALSHHERVKRHLEDAARSLAAAGTIVSEDAPPRVVAQKIDADDPAASEAEATE